MATVVAAAAPKSRTHNTKVQVHPSVILSIIDHHTRRNVAASKADRVIGTLLGVHLAGGVIEITGSYPVPHVEKDKEVAVGKDFNRQMKALHAKSHPGEQVVGWYATSASSEVSIDAKSCLVHDFYSSSECVNPVHLVVDVSLATPLSVRAYHSVALASSPVTRALAAEFRPLPLELQTSEPERIAIATLNGNKQRNSQNLQLSVEKLLALLDTVCTYVDDVVDGRIPPDADMGKSISDIIAGVSHISPEDFAGSFSKSVQDLLMVVMLSNLTRTHLAITEKLNSVS